MAKKAYLYLLTILIPLVVHSQKIEEWNKTAYAKEIIATLASAEMHGRGYVNNGDQLAAAYIRDGFEKFGLRPINGAYYQNLTFPINTFPSTVAISLSGMDRKTKRKLTFTGQPGLNMLIGASFPSTDKKFGVVVFDSSFCVSDAEFERFNSRLPSKAVFILVDDRGTMDKKKLEYFKKVKSNYFNTEGVIEFTNKLTHAVSTNVSKFKTVKILSDSFHLDLAALKKLETVINVENKFIPEHASQNVIGYIPGSVHPDSFLVFCAHYDHLGQLGKEIFFPGANDNASGCAMLLNLAKHYSLPENRPAYSIAFIAFAGEEAGLLGSDYYTKHPLFPLSTICFLLNMDIMGTGDEGITVVNGTLFKKEYEKLVELNQSNGFLKEVRIRGKAANSDHYHFSENGVKAFFIYTMGGIKAYHDVYDRAETLPLTKFEELFKLIISFTEYLQHH
jgi:aminopeptidase YwaD